MSEEFDPLFTFHKLNATGQQRARDVASLFSRLVEELFDVAHGPIGSPSEADARRCSAIVKTKLEEACFFAKKAMALQSANQEPEK